MTTATQSNVTSFAEEKSRHITPARSAYDFQKGDQLLIKSGDSVTRKLVKDMDPKAGTVTGVDPNGGGSVTVKLDPKNLAKDGGEFKYWIDESGETTMPQTLGEMGIDDTIDDFGDDDFGGDDFDMEVESESGDFAEDLQAFIGEMEGEVPDNTVGGGVDDSTHSDEDAVGTEKTPAPHDTTGIQSAGEVSTMAGAGGSNGAGAPPSDVVKQSGSVGGPVTTSPAMPSKGEHTPGKPETHESVVNDVNTALGLVKRGADPTMLASRLLRGA